MKQKFFTKNCPECPENYNNGEKVEWRIGYELTGTPSKRNNKPGAYRCLRAVSNGQISLLP